MLSGAVADQLRGRLLNLGVLMDGAEDENPSYLNFPRGRVSTAARVHLLQ